MNTSSTRNPLRARAGHLAMWVLALVMGLAATGCAQVPRQPLVEQPMSVRPEPARPPAATPGAIYRAGGRGASLFEDRRPRHVGDIITIVINEKVNASKNSATTVSRDGKVAADLSATPKFLAGLLRGQDASLSGSNALNAKGGANAANNFEGIITVAVIDVLANGNLVVSGEKQILINQGTEYIRFSGVVNPSTVVGNNTVSSTLVADARIEYSGKGVIDEAQTMGWLQRFFLNVMPL